MGREARLQSECVCGGFGAQWSGTAALSRGAERPADLSCSCNWHCCFRMKAEDLFLLFREQYGPAELRSIILSKVLLTDGTGYLFIQPRGGLVHAAASLLHDHIRVRFHQEDLNGTIMACLSLFRRSGRDISINVCNLSLLLNESLQTEIVWLSCFPASR